MFELNSDTFSNIRQRPVDGVEKSVFRNIILWSDPFSLQDPPKRFGNVQMRRIWRKIEKKQPTLLPKVTQLLYFSVPMYRSIIKDNKCIFFNFERESLSRKSMTLSALILSVVQNPSYWLLRSIIPKMLSLCAFKDGIYTSSS